MERRLGFVGVLIQERGAQADAVNRILSEFGHLIRARTGLPMSDRSCCVITLIVEAGTDEMGRLTGRLGMIDGVAVKSGLVSTGHKKTRERDSV